MPSPPDAASPSPGERLLFILGQLFRLSRNGELAVPPRLFDVQELARLIGVTTDIELITESAHGTSIHFAGEVLVVDTRQAFPWQLYTLDEWVWVTELSELPDGLPSSTNTVPDQADEDPPGSADDDLPDSADGGRTA